MEFALILLMSVATAIALTCIAGLVYLIILIASEIKNLIKEWRDD